MRAIINLLDYLPTDSSVSIITEQSQCAEYFSRRLAKEIESHDGWQHTGVHVFQVKIDGEGIAEYSRVLLQIQLLYGYHHIIILFTPYWVAEGFIKLSPRFYLDSPEHFWMTPFRSFDPTSLTQHLLYHEVEYDSPDLTYVRDRLIEHFKSTPGMGNTTGALERTNKSLLAPPYHRSNFYYYAHEHWELTYTQTKDGALVAVSSEMTHVESTKLMGNLRLKVVTVLEGPFTLTIDQLFDAGLNSCDLPSLLCRVPETRDKDGKEIFHWRLTCCTGYAIELIKAIKDILKFEIDLYSVADAKYGGYNATSKTWNGMIRDVIDGKADLALAGLTINSVRSEIVDFTDFFMTAEIAILTKDNLGKAGSNLMQVFGVLTTENILMIFFIFLVAMALVFVLDKFVHFFASSIDREQNSESAERKKYSLREAFLYISGLACQRELGGEIPLAVSSRTLALFYAFTMVAVTTLFTASLTASKVVESHENDFKGLKDDRVSIIYLPIQ